MDLQKREQAIAFFNGLNLQFDVFDFIEISNLKDYDFDSLLNELQDSSAFDIEIIYYGSAIEYLTKNDPSLKESLQLANEWGFELKKLNSEVLASLLASRNAYDEFCELEGQINDFINEL